MPKITLSKKPVAKSSGLKDLPPAQTVDMPGVKGTLPFAPGRLILTEYEKRQLKALGWKEGDPIPNISKAVAAAQKEIEEEPDELPPDIKRMTGPPKIVDIETLPKAKQEEIRSIMATATEQYKRYKPMQASQIPGMNEAMAVAKQVEDKEDDEIKTYDSAVIKPKAKPVDKFPSGQQVADAAPKPLPAGDTGVDVPAEPLRCKHCGWATDKSDNLVPSREDKLTFIAAILSQKRFTKVYPLFDGRMHVKFRTLTAPESDIIIKQLVVDWNKNRISGPVHSVQQALLYQQALSLAEIQTAGGPVLLDELKDYEGEPEEGETIVPEVMKYVVEHAMATDSIRRVVGMVYTQFQDLTSKLEAMAETPDFWKATGA